MMRQKNLKANEKLRPRRTEVNLNFLRNDLDIWHRQVNSWIDIENTIPPKDVIKKLGIKVVQKLYIRRSDCQEKLDFNDEEDGYKVEADISHASCTCAYNEKYYKNRISLLEKQKVELENELQR